MKFLFFSLLLALFKISDTNAAIIYTDISDYYLNNGNTKGIDIDGSGGNDVTFYGDGLTSLVPSVQTFFGTGVVSSGFQDVKCLTSGQSISSSSAWQNNSIGYINNSASTSQFPSGVDRFVGVKFQAGSSTLYGWIKVEYTSSALIIKSYAYETSGGSISAGAVGSGTSSIDELDSESFLSIYPNPVIHDLNISVEVKDGFTLSIIDSRGKQVYKATSIGNSFIISTFNFMKGIYFLELKLNDGRQLRRSFVKR